MYITI
jgi:hypothetical protein